MPKYIDVAIISKIVFDHWKECEKIERIIPDIKRAIMYESTADVVKVVRCKDCKHYGDDHFCCYPWCTGPEEFCSRGERRDIEITGIAGEKGEKRI